MRVYKTLVPGIGEMSLYDTIEFEGSLWLVTQWQEKLGEGYKIPERIICPDFRKIQKWEGFGAADFYLPVPIPKAVFDGRDPDPEASGYRVRECPDIRVPINADKH